MLNQRWGDSQGHENREQSRLHVDLRLTQVPEGEAVEETSNDVEHDDTGNVVRIPPDGHEVAVDHCQPLLHVGHSILSVILCLAVLGSRLSLGRNILDFLAELLVFLRLCPDIAPVLTLVVRVTSANSFEHVLGGVLLGFALLGSVALEVLDQVL